MRVLRCSLRCGPPGPAVFLLFYLFYLAVACSDPIEPVIVTPALEAFEARLVPFRFQGEWGLLVEARLVEGDLSLTPNVRVPIRVRTSAGDAEDLVLRPRLCETQDGAEYSCTNFLFSMQPGRHVVEIRAYLDQIPGKLSYVANDGFWGSAWIFEGDVDAAIAVAQRWPGVQSASHSVFARTLGAPGPQYQRLLINITGIGFGASNPGDRTIQAQSGDVVTITYSQPDGVELTASFRMCEEPEGVGIPIGGLGDDPPCADGA